MQSSKGNITATQTGESPSKQNFRKLPRAETAAGYFWLVLQRFCSDYFAYGRKNGEKIVIEFLVLAFFGVGVLAAYWAYCSFTDRNIETGRKFEDEICSPDTDLDNLDDFDSVQRAYDAGFIDDFKLQQLYDDGVIDEDEAELLSNDAIDFDDDDAEDF